MILQRMFKYMSGKEGVIKMNDALDPIEVVMQLIKERKDLMDTFGDEYIAYLEVLNIQVFEPNGYKLFAKKIDE